MSTKGVSSKLSKAALFLSCIAARSDAAELLGPCSPTPLPLLNPGFQSGQLAPWVPIRHPEGEDPLPTNLTVEKLPDTPSNYVLRIDEYVTNYRYDQPVLQQNNLTLCNGYQYQIGFDYKVIRAYPTAQIIVGGNTLDPGERGLEYSHVPANVTTDWQHHTFLNNIIVLTGLNFTVTLLSSRLPKHNMSGASVLMDNFTMVPVKSLIAPGCPYEPVAMANTHFQTGQLAPWQVVPQPGVSNYSVVPGSHGDNQSHALRFASLNNPNGFAFTFTYPIQNVCLSSAYVFEVAYNVIAPTPNPFGAGFNGWGLDMPGCEGVNSSLQPIGGQPSGPGNLDVAGPKKIKAMCLMTHNGGALPRFEFSTIASGNAIVDVLNITARLATSDDLA